MLLPTKPFQGQSSPRDLEVKRNQMTRLMVALSVGLPTLPGYVFQLDELLTANPVDLKRVAKVISTDPSLSAQAIKLCNSGSWSTSHQVSTINEAITLLGTERLRILMLTCPLLEYPLVTSDVQTFWHHSRLTALLSELIARRTGYTDPEKAYLAGLLHDLGFLAFLVVLSTEKLKWDSSLVEGTEATLRAEREQFGMDHCATGGWIGSCWNFPPWLIDVLEHHHRPEEANRDSQLVSIVAAADQFCQSRGVTSGLAMGTVRHRLDPGEQPYDLQLLQDYLPLLAADSGLEEELESELLQFMRSPGFGFSGVYRRSSL